MPNLQKMAKTYKCQTCQREFNRASSLRRHERCVHGLNHLVYSCAECGKNFKRPDTLQKLHRVEYQRSEKIKPEQHTTMSSTPMDEASTERNREESGEPIPKKSKLEKPALEDNTCLKHIDDPELLRLYKTNWRHIRSSTKKRKLLTTYNCYLPTLSTESIVKCVEEVFEEQKNAFKLQVSFGFILRNHETDERRYYYSSRNTKLFPSPQLITDRRSFDTLSPLA